MNFKITFLVVVLIILTSCISPKTTEESNIIDSKVIKESTTIIKEELEEENKHSDKNYSVSNFYELQEYEFNANVQTARYEIVTSRGIVEVKEKAVFLKMAIVYILQTKYLMNYLMTKFG